MPQDSLERRRLDLDADRRAGRSCLAEAFTIMDQSGEPRMRRGLGRGLQVAVGSVGLWTVVVLASRRALLDWGASGAETASVLPGDDLVPDADLVATRAISIAAQPRLVWPWLVQIGIGRAGAYSYEWLERLERLFGLDVHSSHQIVPELQHLAVGDVIPVEQDGSGLRVRATDRESVLAMLTDDGDCSWTWVLRPALVPGFTAGRDGGVGPEPDRPDDEHVRARDPDAVTLRGRADGRAHRRRLSSYPQPGGQAQSVPTDQAGGDLVSRNGEER